MEIGCAMFVGLGIMTLAIPLNGIVAKITEKIQINQMKCKDKRIKLMNEILGGIKVSK